MKKRFGWGHGAGRRRPRRRGRPAAVRPLLAAVALAGVVVAPGVARGEPIDLSQTCEQAFADRYAQIVQGVNAWSDTEYGTDLPSNVPACHGITFTSPDEAALRGQEADSWAPADTTGPHDCRGDYAVLGYCVSKPVVDACAFNGATGAGAAFLVGTGVALLSGGSLTLPEIGAAASAGGTAAVSEAAKDCAKGAGFKAVKQTAGRSITTLDPAAACAGPPSSAWPPRWWATRPAVRCSTCASWPGDGVKECVQRSVDLAHLN